MTRMEGENPEIECREKVAMSPVHLEISDSLLVTIGTETFVQITVINQSAGDNPEESTSDPLAQNLPTEPNSDFVDNSSGPVVTSRKKSRRKVKKNGKSIKTNNRRQFSKKSRSYLCAVCRAEFANEDSFHSHVNDLHTAEFPFPCDKCNKRFAAAIQLKTHQSTHDPKRFEGEPKFQCDFCDMKYHIKGSLATHRNLKHFGYKPPKKSTEERLKMSLPRNKGLIKPRIRKTAGHRKKRNRNRLKARNPDSHELTDKIDEITNPRIQLPKITRSCYCTMCNIILPSQLDFQHHLSSTHADRRFPCRHCGKRFTTFGYLRVHETIHNPNRYQGEPMFSCDLCDSKFHLKSSVYTHRKYKHLGMTRHTYYHKDKLLTSHHSIGVRNPQPKEKPERPVYPCTECDLTFSSPYKLKRHLIRHKNDKPFRCEICGQCFANSSSVHAHRRNVHENPSRFRKQMPTFMYKQMKSWDCETCGRQFRLPWQLRVHIRLHTGERPYQCTTCGERFRIFAGLKNHWKSHVKIRSPMNCFKCLVCGKEGFKRFSEFSAHRKRTHPQIPYQDDKEKAFGCGICGKPYFLRENAVICALLRHDPTRLHNLMFRHKCPECPPERFGHRNFIVLREHWKLEHGDKPIPGKFRVGMYNESMKDSLPSVILDKAKAQEIKEKGIDPLGCQYDFPLFVEFDLMEPPKDLATKVGFTCLICNKVLSNPETLRKHTRVMHAPNRSNVVEPKVPPECTMCGLKFANAHNMRRHLLSQLHQANSVKGEAQKIFRPDSSSRFGIRPKSGSAQVLKAFRTAQVIKAEREESGEKIITFSEQMEGTDNHVEKVISADPDHSSILVPQTYSLRIVETEVTNEGDSGGDADVIINQEKEAELETEFKAIVQKLSLGPPPEKPVVHPSPEETPKIIQKKRPILQKARTPTRKKPDYDPVKCNICHQPFANKTGLSKHMTNMHGKDPSPLKRGPRPHLLPRFMYNPQKDLECDVCKRQFRMPSILRAHKRLHTGERPFKCSVCGEKFRLIEYLREHFKNVHGSKTKKASHLNIYKCRVCGKEGFNGISNFSKHRKAVHTDVPYQDDKEKAFGCAICGKPYFLRENAAICAILKHDPASLQRQMFQVKCPQCPADQIGHRNLLALKKHWEAEHEETPIPPNYRLASASYHEGQQEVLPTVTVDKKKAAEILAYGIPSEKELGYAPFVDLGLFDPKLKYEFKSKPKKRTAVKCSICDKVLCDKTSLKKHLRNVHGEGGPRIKETPGECTVCGLKFLRARYLKYHLSTNLHKTNVAKMKAGERPQGKEKMSTVKLNGVLDKSPILIKSEPVDEMDIMSGDCGDDRSESIEVSEVFMVKVKEEPELPKTTIMSAAEYDSLENENSKLKDSKKTSKMASEMVTGGKIKIKGKKKKKWKIPKKCSICGLILSSSSSLRRHTFRRHPEEDEEDTSKENDGTEVKNVKCPVIISVSSAAEGKKDSQMGGMSSENAEVVVVKQEVEEHLEQDEDVIMDGFCEVGEVEIKVERVGDDECTSKNEKSMALNKTLSETTKNVLPGYEPPEDVVIPVQKRGRGRPRKYFGDNLQSNGKPWMSSSSIGINTGNARLGIKKKRGRPAFMSKQKWSGNSSGGQNYIQGKRLSPRDKDMNDDYQAKNNDCFMCGFKATSVSILRRHVIVEHIDSGESNGESKELNWNNSERCSVTGSSNQSQDIGENSPLELSSPSVEPVEVIGHSGNTHFIANNAERMKSLLGNRECRLIITRVDDDAFDFSDFINLKIC